MKILLYDDHLRINLNVLEKIGAAILAGIIGVLHVFAWCSNKKEIQKINDSKFDSRAKDSLNGY